MRVRPLLVLVQGARASALQMAETSGLAMPTPWPAQGTVSWGTSCGCSQAQGRVGRCARQRVAWCSSSGGGCCRAERRGGSPALRGDHDEATNRRGFG